MDNMEPNSRKFLSKAQIKETDMDLKETKLSSTLDHQKTGRDLNESPSAGIPDVIDTEAGVSTKMKSIKADTLAEQGAEFEGTIAEKPLDLSMLEELNTEPEYGPTPFEENPMTSIEEEAIWPEESMPSLKSASGPEGASMPTLEELATKINNEVGNAPDLEYNLEETHKGLDKIGTDDLHQYIRFFLEDTLLGIPLLSGLEIGHVPDITPLPNLPNWVLGISNIRGEIISVVDFKGFFGWPSHELKRENRFIVLQDKDLKVGMVVDGILGILSLEPAESTIQDNPFEEGELSSFIRGVVVSDEQPLYLLDIEKLLSSPRMIGFRVD